MKLKRNLFVLFQWVGSIDRLSNEEANLNLIVSGTTLQQQNEEIVSKLADSLGGEKLDAIFCVAGGWAGGNAKSKGQS